jgi:DNA-binding GntR family transcriptional regulator
LPRESLTDRVYADLTRRIAEGEFPPGSRLPRTRELVAYYGTSEQPVRAALDRLKWTGVIVGMRGKGFFVPPLPEPEEPS